MLLLQIVNSKKINIIHRQHVSCNFLKGNNTSLFRGEQRSKINQSLLTRLIRVSAQLGNAELLLRVVLEQLRLLVDEEYLGHDHHYLEGRGYCGRYCNYGIL